MAKIPKNLSDKDMFQGHTEKVTFESAWLEDEQPAAKPVKPVKPAASGYASEFFTPELQEKVGKALVEVKLELFKAGVVDFDIKVARQGQQVILSAVPKKQKPAK